MNLQPAAQAGTTPVEPPPPSAARDYLAFRLGSTEYGIDMLRVQEIRSYEKPTHIAGTPDCVKGVINLRGVIVPIVDMRIRIGLDMVRYDAFTVVVVLNVGTRVMGLVVDAVSEVIALQPGQLLPAPLFSQGLCAEHLLAIAAIGTRLLTLVDIDKLLSGADIGLVEPRLQ